MGKLQDKFSARNVVFILVAALAIVLSVNFYYFGYLSQLPNVSNEVNKGKVELFIEDPKPYGLSMADWTIKWWQWVESFEEHENPLYEETGKILQVGQPDLPLYFLTGVDNKNVTRNVTISADKGLMFPVFNNEYHTFDDMPNSNEETKLRANAEADINRATYINAELDGKNLPLYRIRSPLFVMSLPQDNFIETPLQNDKKVYAIGDGYYVFLDPLPVGKHLIHLKGVSPKYRTEATYDIEVQNITTAVKNR